MKEKKLKNKAKKRVSKNFKVKKINSSNVLNLKDSNVSHDDVKKYRATFLVGQRFRGEYYKEGQSIIIPCELAKAYSMRSTIKFEQI